MDLEQLHESVKPIVWLLIMNGDFEGKSRENRQTAFAVKDGYIMTCMHGNWPNWSNLVVKARPLCRRTMYDAEFVVGRRDCDIAIYEVKGVVDMAIGTFGSGVLAVGETLMCVGHPYDLVGSGMFGRVLYPCFAYPRLDFQDELTCKNFNCNTWRNTPHYRVMGHIWNEFTVKEAEEDENDLRDIEFYKQLKGRLPIIQTSGIVSGPGASGAPMFNLKGEIVGMQLMTVEGYDIGAHLRLLVGFLQYTANFTSPTPSGGGSMDVTVSETSESKRGKRQKKI